MYEVKDARKSHKLEGRVLAALQRRAIRQGKNACYLVYFSDIDCTARVTLVPGGRELLPG